MREGFTAISHARNAARIVFATGLLLFLALPALVHGQFTFTTNNGAITITGYNGPAGAVVIPAATNGYPVTSIGDSAFKNSSLTSVTIPNSVTSIGLFGFANSGLTNVTIPNSVTNLGVQAFLTCTSLTSATIGDSVTSIGGGAFLGCTSLTNVTIGNSVTSIGYVAFELSGLTSVTIPNSVTNIGQYAFWRCTSLTNITVDTSNPAYSSSSGVLFDKAQVTLLQFPSGLGGSYAIPNSVTSIESDAVANSVLTNVTIPNSVTIIGDHAFSECSGLTSVVIPNSVISIGDSAFESCFSLANVTIGNSVTNIGGYAFSPARLTSVTIPNSVTGIGQYAFYGCPSLTSAYFQGNAPPDNEMVFYITTAIAYYLPGTAGWGSTFGGVPAVLWNPQANTPGFVGGDFGFDLTGPTNAVIVVEACANLVNPVWSSVGTNTLTGGFSYFSDPQWTNYSTRIYRLRSP